jgi:predicted ATPase
MEKLIIKNFGPIKHIELDVRKFTFLIGEQASGKSTIAKVLSVVKDYTVILDEPSGINEHLTKLGIQNYFKPKTLIRFESSDYDVEIKSSKDFEIALKTKQIRLLQAIRDFSDKAFHKTPKALKQFRTHQEKKNAIYIPAERNLTAHVSGRAFQYINNTTIKLPDHFVHFGRVFQQAREQVKELQIDWLNARYIFSGSEDWIVIANKKTRMAESASGLQNAFPLLLAFEQEELDGYSFFVEEPELSLFPKTQADLIKHIAGKCIENNFSLLITTHSPYILSAFNNLIYAYNVGQKKGNAPKVSKVISKKLWVNPDDVTAVYLDGKGKAKNLMVEDLQQISVDEMDGISQVINAEYDQLAQIEYGRGKR